MKHVDMRKLPAAAPEERRRQVICLAGREAEIEVSCLPPYSPEFNPDEGINGDLKGAVARKARSRSK